MFNLFKISGKPQDGSLSVEVDEKPLKSLDMAKIYNDAWEKAHRSAMREAIQAAIESSIQKCIEGEDGWNQTEEAVDHCTKKHVRREVPVDELSRLRRKWPLANLVNVGGINGYMGFGHCEVDSRFLKALVDKALSEIDQQT